MPAAVYITVRALLVIVAIILFIANAFRVPARVNLESLGLAFLAASFIVPLG